MEAEKREETPQKRGKSREMETADVNQYENRILKALKGRRRDPYTLGELAKKTGANKRQKKDFTEAISSLVAQKRIIDMGGRFLSADSPGLVEGQIVRVNATFGFAAVEGAERDIFIPGRLLRGSMPGDRVLLRSKQGAGELPEGEVLQIIEEVNRKFSGVLRVSRQECVVVPDSYVKFPLPVSRRTLGSAVDGDKVVAEMIERGGRHSEHLVGIVEAFGDAETAQACCAAILSANDISTEFLPETLEQAAAIAGAQGIHPKELAARTDLRDEVIFTIDGADSKDLDDAISLRKLEQGWELGVHIADVSYYVTHQSPLDLEAYQRGTSVYYADSVVPMLPPELSNGICSLNPEEDRLAFSAMVSLDTQGNITGYSFQKTVIRSRVKGVYSEVNAILDGVAEPELLEKYAGLTDNIMLMRELAKILMKRRFSRGGMDLDTVESKIVVGEDGRVLEVRARERGESEHIIEEFMLTANEAAATFALEKALPFVFRTHESPAPDRINNLYEVLDRLGIPAKRPKDGSISTMQLAEIVEKAKGTDVEPIIGTMVLRSMAKAKYTPHNIGHFGLALDNYTHFTSPIRRYPDLTIHRILSGCVTGMRMDNIHKRFDAFVTRSASRSTEREIAAMTAERSCEDCYKAEYLRQFLGEEFDGRVSGVTSFGIYVRLENTAEGLVGLGEFPPGDWEFDGSIAMVERMTNRRIRLGDPVRIQVAGVRVSMGQVDFKLVETAGKSESM